MAESWDFYLCNLNDGIASIALDMGAEAPDLKRPWLLCIRVGLKNETEHGLHAPEESAALSEFEDALTVAMGIHGAFQVGRMTHGGHREFFFYGQEDESLGEILDDVVPGSGYTAGWRTEKDPEWGFYREFLYPNAQTQRWMLDRSVCDQLQDHGDDEDAKRPIDHNINFEGDAPAAFIEAVKADGFTVNVNGGDVGLVREDPTELGHIHELVWGLVTLAEEHGGSYDGWGAPIVKKSE